MPSSKVICSPIIGWRATLNAANQPFMIEIPNFNVIFFGADHQKLSIRGETHVVDIRFVFQLDFELHFAFSNPPNSDEVIPTTHNDMCVWLSLWSDGYVRIWGIFIKIAVRVYAMEYSTFYSFFANMSFWWILCHVENIQIITIAANGKVSLITRKLSENPFPFVVENLDHLLSSNVHATNFMVPPVYQEFAVGRKNWSNRLIW